MANKHVKRCSVSLTIREMNIKITVMYHYTAISNLAIGQNFKSLPCERCEGTGTLMHC